MTDDKKLFTINFGDVEEKDFKPLPAGTYEVEVQEAALKKTQGEVPKPYIGMKLVVVGHEEEDYNGRIIYDNVFLTAASLWRAKKVLKCYGFEADGEVDMREFVHEVVGETGYVVSSPRKLPNGNRVVANITQHLSAEDMEGGDYEDDDDLEVARLF